MVNVMKKRYLKIFTRFIASALIFVLGLTVAAPIATAATTITNVYDRLSTEKMNVTSGVTHYLSFKPTAQVAGGTDSILRLQFPDADDGLWCRVATDLTDTVNTEGGGSNLPGTLTAKCAIGSGGSSYDTIYICATGGSNTWAAATQYGVQVTDGTTGRLGTRTTAGNDLKVIVTTGTATTCTDPTSVVDTGAYALSIITTDQVGVSATVDPLFSFSISQTSIGFGSFANTTKKWATTDGLGATTEPTSGIPTQISITTNAPNGAVVSAKSTGTGAAAGLYKAITPTKLIAAAASSAVTTGTEGYGLYVKNAASYTIDAGFDNNGVSDLAISTAFQPIATLAAAASAATADVALSAAINGTTPAGTYADTLTLVATGKF